MKKSLADRIEKYIKVLINRSEDNQIEIQRIELAETFNCVPSQVTYVISTRFTENEGYFTESRRGGKGFVRITRYSVLNDGGDTTAGNSLFILVDELLNNNILTQKEYDLIKCLVLHSLKNLPPEYRNNLAEGMKKALQEFLEQY